LGCLPAAYRTSPHKSMGHTPYEAMLGRAPPSEDEAATESIPMDEWVQELRVAQEEASECGVNPPLVKNVGSW